MKVTFIGHASVLVEAGGTTILSDPWWHGPCFGAQWWVYPPPRADLVDTNNIDYIYISHGHHDHYHPSTLKTFSRQTKVLVSSELDLASSIRQMGFETLTLRPDEAFQLAEHTRCWIWPTHSRDTLMVIDDGREVCVNANDALHAAPQARQAACLEKLTGMFPQIDYVFCGYGMASHFPTCYEVPGLDRIRTVQKRQHYFNRSWARIIHGLQPHYGFPFAANVVFYEDELFFANEPTHNAERPTDCFRQAYPHSPTRVLDIAPGFTIRDGAVEHEVLRQPVSAETLRHENAHDMVRANRCARVTEPAVTTLADRLRTNIAVCRDYLLEYDGSYRCVITLRHSHSGLLVTKQGTSITVHPVHGNIEAIWEYDVLYKTRLSYLRRSLTRPYGYEVLFVGSGGIFVYRTAEAARHNVHRELRTMMTLHKTCPPSRFGASGKRLYQGKRLVKKLLRMPSAGLYDLQEWLVFSEPSRDVPRPVPPSAPPIEGTDSHARPVPVQVGGDESA